MNYSEALETIHGMASSNRITDADIENGDAGLASQREWQAEALETLEDLVTNHAEEIDDRYAAPANLAPGETAADRSLSPSDPVSAIRICLDMAEGLPDPDEAQSLALATASDFVARHGQALASDITTIRMAS